MSALLLVGPQSGIGIRQPEPPEGRKMYPLLPQKPSAAGGGIYFNANETYKWSSQQSGFNPPSGIMSMWADASQLQGNTDEQYVYLQTKFQRFILLAGNSAAAPPTFGQQGYLIVTSQLPFDLTIGVSSAAVIGQLVVILYNYNVFFTGQGGNPGGRLLGQGATPSAPGGSRATPHSEFL